jgi:retron-type reverse transcriptase
LKELSSGWIKTSYGARQGSIFSPILVNAMMDEITNEVRKKNKRPDVKILIFADIVLI